MEEGSLIVDGDPEILSQILVASQTKANRKTASASFGGFGGENTPNVTTKLYLPNKPALAPWIVERLSALVAERASRRQSIELVLEEALTNAMIHGNLEVPSRLMEEDFTAFYNLVIKRCQEEPYASRLIELEFLISEKVAVFTVTDQGSGFDWRLHAETQMSGDEAYGRGLLIMKALAQSVDFNDTGNQVTLTFGRDERDNSRIAA